MATRSQVQEFNAEDFLCFTEQDVGELGGGLKSTVRLVEHTTLGKVAVKCFSLTTDHNDTEKLQNKIIEELELLQRIANDHVLRAYGWVKCHQFMGIVMPYMPGGDLRELATNESVKLTPKLILRIAYEIASGLAHMHNLSTDEQMVHGDVKPENVLLSDGLHCKVSDFGSAEVVTKTGSTITTGGKRATNRLTIAYAAPEKLKNLNIEIKKEQDTYSFGMILYVLLTRKTPYRHPSLEKTFVDLIKKGKRPNTSLINELRQGLSDKDEQVVTLLRSLMENCWQQDPKSRPSMIDVRNVLRELLNQQNDADIQSDQVEVLKKLSTSIPSAIDEKLVPLHCFSSNDGTFSESIAHNVYNFPKAKQAAFNCRAADFQQLPKRLTENKDQHVPNDKNENKFRVEVLKNSFYASDRSSFPEPVREAADLLEQYEVCLRNRRISEAEAIIKKLISNIESNFATRGWELRNFADHLRKAKCYLESIAMFVASASLFTMHDGEASLEGMGGCLWRMLLVSEVLVGNDVNMTPVVKDHVIPLMCEMKYGIEKLTSVDEETKLEQVRWADENIELSVALVDKPKNAMKAAEEQLSRTEE